jgi:hypothetical protein
LHDPQPELSGSLLCGAANKKKGTEADKLPKIRLQFVTRFYLIIFPSEFLKAPSTGVFAIWFV